MSNKTKFFVLIVLILVVAGYLAYKNKEMKGEKSENKPEMSEQDFLDSISAEEDSYQNFNIQCENGEWVEVADLRGESVSLSGKLRRTYSDDDLSQDIKNFQYYIDGQTKTALSGADLSKLEIFEDRDVEVKGVKSEDGKSVAVSQVRCAGSETDKTSIDSREKAMNWLAENINLIAPQKAPHKQWTVDTADFVDEKNVYVEYYDAVEDDEYSEIDEDTSRMILLEMSTKSDGGYEAKTLASWEMGEDDYVLKSGEDKFEEVMDTYLYQYDFEEKSWTRI